jgi:hypothetical protein
MRLNGRVLCRFFNLVWACPIAFRKKKYTQRYTLFLCKKNNPYISPKLFNNALKTTAEASRGYVAACIGTEKNGIVFYIPDILM